MRSQWADSERTLNVHWTCSERGIEHWGNWGKERIGGNRKKIQYLRFFWKSQSTAQICCYLQLFGLCSMCVQCCVHCMFTVCSMSASTRNLILQETIHLCNPVRPNLSHALQTHNIPWHSGLTWPIPFILIPLRRCVKHGRVQWVGVLGVNVACGPKTKRNAFPRRTLSKVLSLQKLQRQSCKGGIQNTACYASHAFLHKPHTFYDRYHALAMSWQWTYIERTLNMQWTRHRTLRKLRERANRWKSKENSIFAFFLKITINCTDLLLFAAFWTVFNVCSMLRSLYVHCMFNVSFHQKLNLTRNHTPV